MVDKTNKKFLRITSRRDFLKTSGLLSVGVPFSGFGIGALSTSCASLDESLLETKNTERTVAIIGAGIGGLSLSYFLKNQKQQFALFEASARIGGRIYRTESTEWGAYEFSQTDVGLKKLLQAVNLNSTPLDNESWTFEGGSTQFLNSLKEKSFGLLEHRSLKLQHRLIRIRKIGDVFRLYFRTPNDELDLDFAHVVLCLPGNQILDIEGIEEFAPKLSILQSLKIGQIVHAVRLVKPPILNLNNLPRNGSQKSNGLIITEFEDERLMKVRLSKNRTYFTILSTDRKPLRELNEIQKIISKNFSANLSRSELMTPTDSIIDWSAKESINAGYYRINYKSDQSTSFFDGRSSLHLISDSFSASEGRVESVIKLSQKTAGLLSLYS